MYERISTKKLDEFLNVYLTPIAREHGVIQQDEHIMRVTAWTMDYLAVIDNTHKMTREVTRVKSTRELFDFAYAQYLAYLGLPR